MISKTIQYDPKLERSRLFCPLNRSVSELFFSLVDYRNNYFTSDDPNKIIEFYNGFENRDQLIQWMKERPKGVANIYEVEGDKDIIVVIPTADFNGKYAKECRENIFKGLHIVFVESGGREDFYFNYAHNCNVGIGKAMEYNPKWVVFSGDDMYKIEDIAILNGKLRKINPNSVDAVFPFPPTDFHSCPVQIVRMNSRLFNFLTHFIFSRQKRKKAKIISIYDANIHFMRYFPIINNKLCTFINFTTFGIFSFPYILKVEGNLYDETYVNAFEDLDLSLDIFYRNSYTFCTFKIGDYIHSTLGNSLARQYTAIAGSVYFSYKTNQKFNKGQELKKHKLNVRINKRCRKA